jgi:hypothetical protein
MLGGIELPHSAQSLIAVSNSSKASSKVRGILLLRSSADATDCLSSIRREE